MKSQLFIASRLVRHFWVRQCEWDGIEPTELFVVPSASNPWVPLLSRAVMVRNGMMRRLLRGQ